MESIKKWLSPSLELLFSFWEYFGDFIILLILIFQELSSKSGFLKLYKPIMCRIFRSYLAKIPNHLLSLINWGFQNIAFFSLLKLKRI